MTVQTARACPLAGSIESRDTDVCPPPPPMLLDYNFPSLKPPKHSFAITTIQQTVKHNAQDEHDYLGTKYFDCFCQTSIIWRKIPFEITLHNTM